MGKRRSRPRRKSRPRRIIDDLIGDTGKTPHQWVEELKEIGAADMSHMQIVEALISEHNITVYQAQVLAHYFNKHR